MSSAVAATACLEDLGNSEKLSLLKAVDVEIFVMKSPCLGRGVVSSERAEVIVVVYGADCLYMFSTKDLRSS